MSDTISKEITVTADVRGYLYRDHYWSGERNFDSEGIGLPDLFVTLMQGGTKFAVAPDSDEGHSFDRQTGEYTFSRLPAGDYEVRVTHQGSTSPVVPDKWTLTEPSGMEPMEPIAALNVSTALPTVAPSTKQGPNFGFSQGFIIRGSVFRDDGGGTADNANDGKRQSGERGLSGLRLRALEGTNIVGSALTDATGAYEFISVGAGSTEPPMIRLVLTGNHLRATGYTPGTGESPVQLETFDETVDVQPAGNGAVREGVDFGVVPQLVADGTSPGAASAGGLQVYPFVVIPGTEGVLEFAVDSARGWQYTVYRDADGDGQLGSGDALVGEGSSLSVAPGDHRFLLVVRVPTSESEGQIDMARVTATLRYDNNTELIETQEFYSMTTVQSARLQLTASVRNVSQLIPEGGGFSPTMVEAKSGDIVEYRIEYHNTDAVTADLVMLHGPIPAGTSLVGNAYMDEHPVKWTHHDTAGTEYPSVGEPLMGLSFVVGDVLPGQSGSFTYQVKLD